MEPQPNGIQYAASPALPSALLSPPPKALKRFRDTQQSSPEPVKRPCAGLASLPAGRIRGEVLDRNNTGIKIRFKLVDIYSEAEGIKEEKTDLKVYKEAVGMRALGSGYSKQRAEDYQSLTMIKRICALAALAQPIKPKPLPRLSPHSKLLIFDLDNTLVYSTPSTTGSSHQISVQLPTGKAITAGLRIRPYAQECLHLASQLFEVAVFTASYRCYSDQVLDLLDPQKAIIQHRLFREDCWKLEEKVLVKDLRFIENFALKDIAIVENSVASFCLQLYNGVPVSTWNGEAEDCQLRELMLYLRALAECEDVRRLNKEVFEEYYARLSEESGETSIIKTC